MYALCGHMDAGLQTFQEMVENWVYVQHDLRTYVPMAEHIVYVYCRYTFVHTYVLRMDTQKFINRDVRMYVGTYVHTMIKEIQ